MLTGGEWALCPWLPPPWTSREDASGGHQLACDPERPPPRDGGPRGGGDSGRLGLWRPSVLALECLATLSFRSPLLLGAGLGRPQAQGPSKP